MEDLKIIAVAMLIGLPAIGSAIGIGNVGASLIEGTARQPHEANNLASKFFIVAGMIEAAPMIAIGVGLAIMFSE